MKPAHTQMSRRSFLGCNTAILPLALAGITLTGFVTTAKATTKTGGETMLGEPVTDGSYEITRSDQEWRDVLGENRFLILRREKTERQYTSPLLDEKRAGIYACGGCDLPAYRSQDKYDSGTGWPSFVRSIPDAVRVKADRKFFILRTEVHCRRCGGHFGHIFDDGPQPTGMRHCINGIALNFIPETA